MQQFGIRKVLLLIFLTLGAISFLQAQNNSQSLANAVSGAAITKDPERHNQNDLEDRWVDEPYFQPGSAQ